MGMLSNGGKGVGNGLGLSNTQGVGKRWGCLAMGKGGKKWGRGKQWYGLS